MSGARDIERMARHRAEMQRALADRCSLAEARRRISQERWAEADRRLAARTREIGRAVCLSAFDQGEPRDPQPWMMRD